LLVGLYSSSQAETINANMNISAQLEPTCTVTANNIDFGVVTNIMDRIIFINDNFSFRCNKGVVAAIGFRGDYNDTETLYRRYMVGSQPTNKDRIVFAIGTRAGFYTTDGSNGNADYRHYIGTGEKTNFNIFPNLRITVVGAIINNELTTLSSDLITADNYAATLRLSLDY
jgi:hypothetical protein